MLFDYLVKPYFEQHKYVIFGYLLLIIVSIPLEAVVLPHVYGKMFNSIKSSNLGSNIWNFTDNINKENFAGTSILLFGVWVLIIGSSVTKHFFESFLVPEYMKYSRDIIYEKTIEAYSSDFRDMKTGEYLSRVLELTRNFKDLFQYILSRAFPELMICLFIVGYFLFNQTHLGLLCVSCISLSIIIHWFGGRYLINKVKEKEQYYDGVVGENLQDSLDNLMNIYINNEVKAQIKKNEMLEENNNKNMKHIMTVQNSVIGITQFINTFCYGFSLLLIYYLLKSKKITIKEAIVYILIMGQLVSYLYPANSGFVHNVIYKLGIIEASREHLEGLLSVDTNKKNIDCINKGCVEFKNVGFSYNKESKESLFTDLSLKLDSEKKYGMVGRSGSGKSTLMKMLVGLYPVDKGEISIDGTNIKTIKPEYLRERVNYVNQRTGLFNEPIVENMLYGNEKVSKTELLKKLEEYKLLDVFSDLPDGINASAGVHGNNLSGGMQKITMLMRGILKPCKILILDEPLAGLDQHTRVKVIDMINIESKGKTLVIITHDKEILPHMDEIININKL